MEAMAENLKQSMKCLMCLGDEKYSTVVIFLAQPQTYALGSRGRI
jgi:hypothetical protein